MFLNISNTPAILPYVNSRWLWNIPKGGRINFPNFINNRPFLKFSPPPHTQVLTETNFESETVKRFIIPNIGVGPSAGTRLYTPAWIIFRAAKIGTKRQFIPFVNTLSSPQLSPLSSATPPQMLKDNIVLCPAIIVESYYHYNRPRRQLLRTTLFHGGGPF